MVSMECCNTRCPYMVKNMSSQCVCALTACPFQKVGQQPGVRQKKTERKGLRWQNKLH